MRRLRWLLPLAALPLLGLLAWGFRLNPRVIPSPLVGRPAPGFALPALDGSTVRLADLRGQVVVINFWASWCYPACYDEAPVLERHWQRLRPSGLSVLGINIQDADDRARKFVADFQLTFPNVRDVDGRVAIDYGVYGVPETFVVDRAGRIAAKHAGAVTDAFFAAHVEPSLAR